VCVCVCVYWVVKKTLAQAIQLAREPMNAVNE
jgi:hypothetical protein